MATGVSIQERRREAAFARRTTANAGGSWGRMIAASRTPRLRTLREFAEQDLIIPDGPARGTRFRVDRQPLFGLFLDEVDSGRWMRFAVSGCVQSGKTLLAVVLPCLFHLFETGETVIMGLPDANMAGDKYFDDLHPAIAASRYRGFLPRAGGGSRGGKVQSIRFGNGAELRFMSAGGGDGQRAGKTARVVVATEVDKMDTTAESSLETNKVSQIEARTSAYDLRARIFLECTVTVEEGRIWREIKQGSDSRIIVPCPRCAAWVTPERDDLGGGARPRPNWTRRRRPILSVPRAAPRSARPSGRT